MLMRSSSPRASSVRSSSVVLPDPGEDTRLSAAMPASCSCRRTVAAISSFFAMTRSRTSIVRTAIIHLQVGEPEIRTGTRDDRGDGPGKRRCVEQRLETEPEVLHLDIGIVANLDADSPQLADGPRLEVRLRHAAYLQREAQLVHASGA